MCYILYILYQEFTYLIYFFALIMLFGFVFCFVFCF